jgi:ACS family tartrate transporter-like MFS transporter
MDGAGGLHGWQWLFVLEGSPALLLGFAVLAFLPNGPADAAWLSAEEKQAIAARLRKEDVAEHRDLFKALRDFRVIALGLSNLGILFGIYGVGLWLPQIVQAMGFSIFTTGFVVAAPYLVSMATMILWGASSDRRAERIWHTALPSLLAAAGFAFASLMQDNVLVLLGLTLAVIGVYATLAPLSSLPLTIFAGPAAAGGFGLVFAIASLGGFLGPAVIGVIREETGGYAAGMAALAVGLVLAALIVLGTGRAMARRKLPLPQRGEGLGVGGGAE